MKQAYAHLSQDTRTSKKAHTLKFLRQFTSGNYHWNGLLVVHKPKPLLNHNQLIIVPVELLQRLLTAMHIRLNHPTKNQLGKIFQSYFYAFNSDKAIQERSSDSCI